jgi:hypothetical protein
MKVLKRTAAVFRVALAIGVASLAASSSAEARGWGHGGAWHHGGGGFGPSFVGGLALGSFAAAGPHYYGAVPYYGTYAYEDDLDLGGCELRRRVRYTPYGPVVRHVRVCY